MRQSMLADAYKNNTSELESNLEKKSKKEKSEPSINEKDIRKEFKETNRKFKETNREIKSINKESKEKANFLFDEKSIRKNLKNKNKESKIQNKELKIQNKENKSLKKLNTIDGMNYDELIHYANVLGLTVPNNIDIKELNILILKSGG